MNSQIKDFVGSLLRGEAVDWSKDFTSLLSRLWENDSSLKFLHISNDKRSTWMACFLEEREGVLAFAACLSQNTCLKSLE